MMDGWSIDTGGWRWGSGLEVGVVDRHQTLLATGVHHLHPALEHLHHGQRLTFGNRQFSFLGCTVIEGNLGRDGCRSRAQK
jgi:hypothetical protein